MKDILKCKNNVYIYLHLYITLCRVTKVCENIGMQSTAANGILKNMEKSRVHVKSYKYVNYVNWLDVKQYFELTS